jgi:flagellar biosynthesis/type III secretory pathway M-ring protein FliF/YscJ
MRDVVTLAEWAVAALLGLLVVLLGARYWIRRRIERASQRLRLGGLDLERLRRLRDAGEVTPEEFEAIRSRVTGGEPPDRFAKPAGEPPIEDHARPASGPTKQDERAP